VNPNAFKYLWTPDRGIQGQAKSGSKIAGVTRGVGIHVFAFSLVFKDCGPRLKDCRGDEGVGIHVFAFSFVLKTVDP